MAPCIWIFLRLAATQLPICCHARTLRQAGTSQEVSLDPLNFVDHLASCHCWHIILDLHSTRERLFILAQESRRYDGLPAASLSCFRTFCQFASRDSSPAQVRRASIAGASQRSRRRNLHESFNQALDLTSTLLNILYGTNASIPLWNFHGTNFGPAGSRLMRRSTDSLCIPGPA